MARTTDPSRNSAGADRPVNRRAQRRLFWTRLVAAFLVLAMLMPVLIFFL